MAHLFVPSNSSFILSAKKKFPASLPNRLNVFKLRMISKQKIFKRRSCAYWQGARFIAVQLLYIDRFAPIPYSKDSKYTSANPTAKNTICAVSVHTFAKLGCVS